MKKLLLFFTVVLSLIGVSPSAFAWSDHTVYVDVSAPGWSNVYFQYGGTDDTSQTPSLSAEGQATLVPGTTSIYKCVFTTGSKYTMHFSKASVNGNYSNYSYDGSNDNGDYTSWNNTDLWKVIDDRLIILKASENGASDNQDNYTPPAVTISSIALWDKEASNSALATFTGYSLTKSGINSDQNSGWGTCRYFIRATYTDGTKKDYSIGSGNPMTIQSGTTYTSLSSASFGSSDNGWHAFDTGNSFYFGDGDANKNITVNFAVTVNDANTEITSITATWGNTDPTVPATISSIALWDKEASNSALATFTGYSLTKSGINSDQNSGWGTCRYFIRATYTDGTKKDYSIGSGNPKTIQSGTKYTSLTSQSYGKNDNGWHTFNTGDSFYFGDGDANKNITVKFTVTVNDANTEITSITATWGNTDPTITTVQLVDASGEVKGTFTGSSLSATVDRGTTGYFIRANYSDGSKRDYSITNDAPATIANGTSYSGSALFSSTTAHWGTSHTFTFPATSDGTNPSVKLTIAKNAANTSITTLSASWNEGGSTDAVKKVSLLDWNGTNYGDASYKDGVWMVTATGITAPQNDNDNNAAKFVFQVQYNQGDNKYVTSDNRNQWITNIPGSISGLEFCASTQTNYFSVKDADSSKTYDFLLEMNAEGTSATKITVREHVSENMNFEDWPTKKWNLETAFKGVYGTPQAGDKLYFYLSTTQNDNRVGPEWMLLPKDKTSPRAGEFVLEDFMVIPNGNFRIREFTYKSAGSYDHKDLKNSAGAVELGKSSFGISGPLAEGTQPEVELTLSDTGGLSKWQIGYTRMTLTVKTTHTEAYTGPAFDSSDNVIIYSGNKSYTHVYAWNDGDDKNAAWPGQKLIDAGNGLKYAVLPRQFSNFKFSGDGETGDLTKNGKSSNQQYADEDIVDRWSDIPNVYHPAGYSYDMTSTLLLDKPSTLSEAPVQGMPYLTLYGSKLKPRLGAYQTLDYILDLDNGADTEAYTNAYLQYDEEGNLYVYGDNITSAYYVQGDTHGVPATGKVMNSTIQPPRNLMYFRLKDTENDVYYDLTSRSTQFKYEGTYSDKATADASNGKIKEGKKLQPSSNGQKAKTGTRYARYYLEDFNMMGNYKVMSGYSGHKYWGTVNGLSLYTNWGTGDGGAYDSKTLDSGTVYPLSGAGPVFSTQDTTPDGESNQNQDNKAGVYVGFADRSYVSKAYFYYALDRDEIYGKLHSHYDNYDRNNNNGDEVVFANDHDVVGNNGRNYSWIMFVYSNTAAQIDLKKIDADKAQMTWLVGSSEGPDTDKDAITHYTVELFKADKNGEPTGPAIYTYTSENYSPSINYIPKTSQMAVEGNGSEMVLDGGAYVAKLTYHGNLIIDEDIVNNTSREVLSSVIHVYKVSADPKLEVNQVTSSSQTSTGDEVTEYTFDGLIKSNLKAYIENLIAQDFDVAGGENFTVKLTFPHAAWQTVTVENESHAMVDPAESDVTEAGGNMTLTLGTYFLNAGDRYRLPNVKVTDYVPGRTYPVSLSVEVTGHEDDANVSKTVSTDLFIKAPAGKFFGDAETGTTVKFDGDKRTEDLTFNKSDGKRIEGQEDYNFVSVPDGYISIEGNETLNETTAQKWKAVYDLYLSSGDDEMISLFDDPQEVNGHGESTVKKFLSTPVTNIGYLPEIEEGKVVGTPQREYTFTVVTNYTLKDPAVDYQKSDYTSDITDNPRTTFLTYQPEDLIAPRTGLGDLKAEGGKKAKDWVRVKYDWFEQYSGAFRVVEDAYVAAEVVEPSELAFRFDIYNQYIRHNSKSVFNKNNHLSSKGGATPHSAAPGLRMPQLGQNEKAVALTENVYWFNTGWRKAPAGFEERVYKGASGISYEGVKPNQIVVEGKNSFSAHEPAPFWAGCHGDVWSNNSLLVDGKKRTTYADMPVSTGGTVSQSIDRLDPKLGLYGNRNHQTRRGWDGGEFFEQKWLNLCVTKSADKTGSGSIAALLDPQGTGEVTIPNPFESVADANSYYNVTYVNPGVDYAWAMEDSEQNPLGDKDAEPMDKSSSDVYGRSFFLGGKFAAPLSGYKPLAEVNGGKGMMRVMLRVPHVNHESWWEPRAGYTEGLQRWKKDFAGQKIKNLSGVEKTVGENATFEDMVEGLIMVPTQYYAPMEYSFMYEYPFLNTNKFAKATPSVPQEANSVNMTRFTANDDDDRAELISNHTYIPAVSTGEIPFDYATTGSGKGTATDIESVGADNGDDADRFSVRYDRSIDAVVVSSTAPLGDIRVVSTTGALLRHVGASQQTLVTIPVDALSSGAYIVSVEGRKGVTFLK